jgi:hypothetical protein
MDVSRSARRNYLGTAYRIIIKCIAEESIHLAISENKYWTPKTFLLICYSKSLNVTKIKE